MGWLRKENEGVVNDQKMVLVKRGILVAMVCGVLVFGCKRVFAVDGVANAGYGVIALLGLSAFFSMAETTITTLWPWKIPWKQTVNGEQQRKKDRWKLLRVKREKKSIAARGGMETLRSALQRLYMTRASAYRDALKSFIEGY
ncbi:hypothetical protein GOBAR_AA27512 [Gossypium barbadense]|uniref:Uncharacterized protein n=1 Tax=Gossypium barbadense TaxID=3634 RepID=A0A2P5WQ30_GOSBA|nr:hypothetical protein GOBAR_AA27512 [Gossypium barbadense]